MARVYKTCGFEIKLSIPTIWAQGTPSLGNKIAEMCHRYRRTGLENKACLYVREMYDRYKYLEKH